MHTNLLPFQGEASFFPDFFSEQESDLLFQKAVEEIHWKQEPIWMFGKKVMQPRLTALYGHPEISYGYSGIEMKPFPWTDFLLEIKNRIEKEAGVIFTHVLLNHYRDGKDSMGWHRDNEKVLGPNPVIGSVSFGANRNFQLRHYLDKQHMISLDLSHGSFLLMKGETQHHWEHQIPKTAKIIGPRINMTFRRIG
ncbi:alpha-ketoglutarate-dependent dioxygenase AlkB [Rhodonellum sp.]|uniref:alpha-ketoglutarate-dependent dioxygenase AlkB family protein n=1 Tax=Rhodonellum sp. TaxID=2231180 RepID=UPI0027215BBE|nr:alpha-ketoglutarate-dependent dioxygenase AlkB [Rhodonellum sp.]MDO9554324.1 alpha-ketoglutarate-dependent dioxygenase AlkB [Rhodonellum sp.]